ncbi:MAG: type II toxin-antitoxin system YafQ family toxin [bacterium]
MSLKFKTTKQFEKDLLKMKKRGNEVKRLLDVMDMIITNKPFDKKYKNHSLSGNYRNRMECHIKPDWLLIYKIDTDIVIFERTGTHSDLFN